VHDLVVLNFNLDLTKVDNLHQEKWLTSLEPIVVMLGKGIFREPYLLHNMPEKYLLELWAIVENPEHPWMKEHYERIKKFEDDVKKLTQERLIEKELKEKRRKHLTIKIKKVFWNKKSNFQKFYWLLPRIVFLAAISIPLLYFIIGISVELVFGYTIKLF
jgi:hypothetical protein